MIDKKLVLAIAATATVTCATSATAGSLLTSAQIKDGAIRNADVKKGTITMNRLSPGLQELIRKGASAEARADSLSAAGVTGPAGPAGAKGEQGASGAQGLQGLQGLAGKDGADGIDGLDGEDGRNGTNGADGKDGKDGINGTNGLNGINGTNPASLVAAVGDLDWKQSAGVPARIVGGEVVMEGTGKTGLKKTLDAATAIPCAQLDSLRYSFRVDRRADGTKVAPAVKLEVLKAQTGTESGYTTLVLEPTYQPGRSTVETSREGTVNGLAAGNAWWSTRSIPGNTNAATMPLPSFQELCAANPDMTIVSVAIESGSGSGEGYAAAADDLVFDGARFDFGG